MNGVYLVTIEALPNPDTEEFDDCGGAYVNVYVREASEDAALASAQREVAAAGWTCKAVDSVAYVTREDFTEDDEGLESFDLAFNDGLALVFYTFPVDPEDDDVVH